jgi:hypothetical protein
MLTVDGVLKVKILRGQSSPTDAQSASIMSNQLDGNLPLTVAFETAVMPTPTADAILLRPNLLASDDAELSILPLFTKGGETQPHNLWLDEGYEKASKAGMETTPFLEIGNRLEHLRKSVSDLRQKEWAEKHGFAPTQYNNWAKGGRRIPVDSAAVLCDLYGLTLDFVYRGRLDGLSENARKIF